MAKTPQRQLGRVPDDEWAWFHRAADAEGLPVSQWMRRALRQAAYREDRRRTEERLAMERLVAHHTMDTNPLPGVDIPDILAE